MVLKWRLHLCRPTSENQIFNEHRTVQFENCYLVSDSYMILHSELDLQVDFKSNTLCLFRSIEGL